MGEGAHGGVWTFLVSGAAARVSRDGHTVRPATPPASSIPRLDRREHLRAFGGGAAIPGYRSGPSWVDGGVTVAAVTVRTRPWNPSPGRAPPSAAHPLVVDTAIALFLAALSLLANLGAAPYVGPLSGGHPGAPAAGEPAADRPSPVPARGPGRHHGRVDRPARAPPGGPVTHGGPGHPRRGLHRRRARRAPEVAHRHRAAAALLAIGFVGRAGIAAVLCRSSRRS